MKKLLVVIAVLMLVACGETDHHKYMQQQQSMQSSQVPTQPVAQGQPVIVNQPQQSSGITEMLLGGAAGYMLGSMNNSNNQSRVIERETKIIERVPAPVTPPVTRSVIPSQGQTITKVDPPKVLTPAPQPTYTPKQFSGSSIGSSSRSYSSPSRSSSGRR